MSLKNNEDKKFPHVPNDTVAGISCDAQGTTHYIAAGSWSNIASLWSFTDNMITPIRQFTHQSPVLTTAISASNQCVFTGTADGTVSRCGLNDGTPVKILESTGGKMISSVRFLPKHSILAVASYDKTVRLVDVRTNALVAKPYEFTDRVTAFDAQENFAIAAIGVDKYSLIDFTKPYVEELNSPHITNDCGSASHGTVACQLTDKRKTAAISSIESRVQIYNLFDTSKSFPFRAHKSNDIHNTISAVNFHPTQSIIATASTAGDFSFWDYGLKQHVVNYSTTNGPKCISSATFSPDGHVYYYSNSYNWYKGVKSPLRNEEHMIFAHTMGPRDYKKQN